MAHRQNTKASASSIQQKKLVDALGTLPDNSGRRHPNGQNRKGKAGYCQDTGRLQLRGQIVNGSL
jgi:hypothetical protein